VAGEWIAERGWVAPEHGGACFASLPGTVTELLCGSALGPVLPASLRGGLDERYERVVLVYFDAFSLEVAQRHSSHPLLDRAARDGQISRLTSQFPSTTTVHMTTIHSGLPVAEHGLYEWFVLEPSLERLIAPLPFTYAGDGGGPLDLDPAGLYPSQTIYEWLAQRGVASAVLGSMVFAGSPTSRALLRGATEQLGFFGLADGLAELAAAMARLPAPAYGFAYIDSLDTLLHKVGPGDPQRTGIEAEVGVILDAIERSLLDALPAGTLLLLTADHGMTPVSPAQTIYVNVGEPGTRIAPLVRVGREPDGHPLAPAGSCRDLFLHAAPGATDELVAALARLLGERAEVRRVDELLAAGVFGPDPGPRLLERLADVVVLPVLGEAVYWLTPGRFHQTLWGQHGGLSAPEMEIPLIALTAG
jgi:hypothetical protein